jgi:hypothetical protein
MTQAALSVPCLVDPATRRVVYRVAPSCRVIAYASHATQNYSMVLLWCVYMSCKS